MADTTNLLRFAIEKNPVDFAGTLNQMLQQKAQDAVDAHRITLAQSIHGSDNDFEADEADEVDSNEFEFTDDELNDLVDEDELDLEDLDLEDLDLDDNYEDNTDAEDA